jgi:Prophage protein (DUF1660)
MRIGNARRAPADTLGRVRCALFGHRYRFRVEDATMTWACERCGHEGGEKTYATPEDARRYANAFDREDRHELGRRAPLVALLPLRLWRAARRRSSR